MKNKTIISIILVFLIALFGALLFFWWQIRTPYSKAAGKTIFIVSKGDSAKVIADNLVKAGLIEDSFTFRLYVFLSLNQFFLKPGEYEIFYDMSIREIADAFALGGVNEVTVTIPEGFSLKQIEDELVEVRLAKKDELLNFKFSQNAPPILKDKPRPASLEGYLFPDTYRFFKDAALSDVASKMVANLDTKLTSDLKSAIATSPYNLHQILIMASLIEKEIPKDSDREIVSGILWKRFETGMPLQVDATLVYITGRNEITDADKKINSPYNTYYYRGLPKGPIGNPGLSAIKAAIHPKESVYWYYLSAKNETTIFSKTLEEHNRNRALYLK